MNRVGSKIKKILIVGGGLTAAAAAAELSTLDDIEIRVHEGEYEVGGNLKTGLINGVLYELQGAHISHTENKQAISFLKRFANWEPYRHIVKTMVPPGLMTWPPQISELTLTKEWPTIKKELSELPNKPNESNFETYALSIMGKTLYEWFIYPYTFKQWGQDPKNISSSFAPKRIDLRQDDYLPLFRESWQGWPIGGWGELVKNVFASRSNISIVCKKYETEQTVDWGHWDAVLVTAPLDDFLGIEQFEWRGVEFEHEYFPAVSDVLLPAGVVNYPGLEFPYTRIIETKWMSGQRSKVQGTVLSREFPGSKSKHYPVEDPNGVNRKKAQDAIFLLQKLHPNSFVAGRLANFVYIDTDQAIMQGINVAKKISKFVSN